MKKDTYRRRAKVIKAMWEQKDSLRSLDRSLLTEYFGDVFKKYKER